MNAPQETVEQVRTALGLHMVPRHVAVIMDGNGRWAARHGLPRIEGHRAGAKSVTATVRAARRTGVEYLTLYAFSSENWKRPAREVAALMRLLNDFLVENLSEMMTHDIRLRTIGDTERLPLYVRSRLRRAMNQTAGCHSMTLMLALSYGGRDEIVRAVTRLLADTSRRPAPLTAETFAHYLDTAGCPDPDLLIRTSAEQRISNFLLWQCAYTEFYFPDILWPDFREEHFYEALRNYQERERRFGGLAPAAQKEPCL